MRAGQLDRRITFQKFSVTQNSFGELDETWADYVTVWAERSQLRGREFWASRQVAAELTTRYRIRYRDDLEPTMRIVDGSRTYDIQAIIEMSDRNHWLEILAEARAE